MTDGKVVNSVGRMPTRLSVLAFVKGGFVGRAEEGKKSGCGRLRKLSPHLALTVTQRGGCRNPQFTVCETSLEGLVSLLKWCSSQVEEQH